MRPGFGASDRFVVAPGQENTGVFHMPTGQSGHPLSPYYNLGHDDWMSGKPTPFVPGEAKWHLRFQPG
jgi:penicillin amidase